VTYGHHWYTAQRFCLCIHLPAASEVAESEAKELLLEMFLWKQSVGKKQQKKRMRGEKQTQN
jgi:hypothetical protein